jgi:hypothetical protein
MPEVHDHCCGLLALCEQIVNLKSEIDAANLKSDLLPALHSRAALPTDTQCQKSLIIAVGCWHIVNKL